MLLFQCRQFVHFVVAAFVVGRLFQFLFDPKAQREMMLIDFCSSAVILCVAFAVKGKQKKVVKAGDAASDDYSEPATSHHRLNVKSAAVLANQVPRFPQTVNLCHLSSETAC